jgi:hypothetical protein
VNASGNTGNFTAVISGNTPYCIGGQIALSNLGNGKYVINMNNGSELNISNDDVNAPMVAAGNTLDYAIATQSITATTLTAVTNAKTPTMPNNGTTAAAAIGGVLSACCKIICNQATGGTVQFCVKASAAPADLWVMEKDDSGEYVAPTYTTIISAIATATSPTITPTAFGTTYSSDLWLSMNPGTTNNVSVQIYALTSSGSDTLTIEPGTGCTPWR